MKAVSLFAAAAVFLAAPSFAASKPEDLIKARQAAYQFMSWNMGRIKANVQPNATFNKDEVVKAANAIQGVANAGLGATYAKGTETGKGYATTRVKPEAFMPEYGEKLKEVATNFNREANALASVAAGGDKAAVAAQFAKLGETCKACHDTFRQK